MIHPTALLLAYSASVSTTVLPCLQHIISPPTPRLTAAPSGAPPQGRNFQLLFGLSTYIPFLLLPLAMGVDMLIRLTGIVGELQERQAGKKMA